MVLGGGVSFSLSLPSDGYHLVVGVRRRQLFRGDGLRGVGGGGGGNPDHPISEDTPVEEERWVFPNSFFGVSGDCWDALDYEIPGVPVLLHRHHLLSLRRPPGR